MSLTSDDFQFLSTLVRRESAIVLEPGKEFLCETRLTRLARELELPSMAELLARLRKQPAGELLRAVVDSMTTNETSWLRDVQPFDALRQHVLPALAKRGGQITIWSAAASTGQEAYSMAMTILEHHPALAPLVRIVGTDLSREAISKAKAGRYTQFEVNRGLPAVMLVKHFEQQGGDWVLKPHVRRMVTFTEMNLISTWTAVPAQVDVVFLRNVLIYFDLETKRSILAGVRRVLRSDGVLFVGSGESLQGVDDRYERVTLGRTVAWRSTSTRGPQPNLGANYV
ncbi:MAG: protein-glutamate O-methyltransferase CheR [Kofleriaceae bacterium]|nr:protein-glutamate O-methyltransferase CheR [Kofleriaceae bacterium]